MNDTKLIAAMRTLLDAHVEPEHPHRRATDPTGPHRRATDHERTEGKEAGIDFAKRTDELLREWARSLYQILAEQKERLNGAHLA